MPQTTPAPLPPAERTAARICRRANAKGITDAGPAIAELTRRVGGDKADAAIKMAIERGWLRREADAYVVSPTGAELGAARSGKKARRVMPF
jgi:hypothetical protein